MKFSKQFDGISISYFDTGKPNDGRPTLCFFHGNSSSKQSFENQFKGILKDRYRLVAFDLPGQGESQWTSSSEAPYQLNHLLKIIDQVTYQLGCSDGILIGHSLGGHLLLQSALKCNKFKGMVLFGTPPLTNPPNFMEGFFPTEAVSSFFKKDLTEKEIQTWAEHCFSSPHLIPEYFCSSIRATDPHLREAFAQMLGSLQYNDEKKILENLEMPVALFHGEKDRLINLSYLQSLQPKKLWRNQVCVLKETSHNPHIEDPAAFDLLLSQFADEIAFS